MIDGGKGRERAVCCVRLHLLSLQQARLCSELHFF